MKKNYIDIFLLIIIFLVLLVGVQSAFGQHEFASVVISENQVNNSGRAIDANLLSSAVINANSGSAVGIGAYTGHLEIEFPNEISANKTSYIRLDTADGLLPFLLGGSLGKLLANVTGSVILGNQEISVTVKNGNTTIHQGDSGEANSFASNAMRVVSDSDGEYFIAVSPNLAYNRIRLENRIGALVGLNSQKAMNVYGAFYSEATPNCLNASYTSFDGEGITLDLLQVAGTGVTNPQFAIDNDSSTFSEIGFGIVNVVATMSQSMYFDVPSDANDVFYLTIGMDPSLLQLGILNNIQFSAGNGSDTNLYTEKLSNLIDLDLLGLLSDYGSVTIPIKPGVPVDRISVDVTSLLGVNTNQHLRIYNVTKAPEIPTIDSSSQNLVICEGSSVELLATTTDSSNEELVWYDAEIDGNVLAVLDAGESYETPILFDSITYYVASREKGCLQESIRAAVPVTVLNKPTATDISVAESEIKYCSSGDVILVPQSDILGTFEWFFDINATNQILDGMVDGDITYTISDTGTLTIKGLDVSASPYDYFVRLQQGVEGCTNADGDLNAVSVSVLDSTFDIEASIDTTITVQDMLDFNNGKQYIVLTGTISGDVNEGDAVTLRINNTDYEGTIGANLEFAMEVESIDILSDKDNKVELTASSGICFVADQLPLPLPDLPVGELTQVFCASDNPTILDIVLDLDDSVFFDAMVGGRLLGMDTPLIDGEVYFAGLPNLPINAFARVAIHVQVVDVDSPTTSAESQTFCESLNPVIGDLEVDQDEVVFYDSPIDGNMLNPSDALEEGAYYIARLENGCESKSRLRINVTLIEDASITIYGQTSEACVSTRSYTYSTDSNQTNYTWTVSGGVIVEGGTATDDFVTVTWSDLQDTFLEVSYVSNDSCASNKESRMEIETIRCGEVLGAEFCLEVFNEFSPNSDGFNDFFEVECITDYVNTTRVYNRNGNLVFETKNYQNNWNGVANVSGVLNNGDHLPAGTYYYVINIPELDRDLVGWLQLAR